MFELHYNDSKHALAGFSPPQLFLGRGLDIPLYGNGEPRCVEEFQDYLNRLEGQKEEINKAVAKSEKTYFISDDEQVRGRKITTI